MVEDRPDLQARRRAATRDSIVRAGARLFETRGYAETSIRDISLEAGVASRTIYLHFGSKAAILLAYFDDWMDDWIDGICAGPPDEDVVVAVARSYELLDAAGKVDTRTFDQMDAVHPIVEFLASPNLDVPGHVLQWWVRAQDRLIDHFARATDSDSLVLPRAKAAAIFSCWLVTLMAYRDVRAGDRAATGPLHEFAFETLTRFSEGLKNDYPPSDAVVRPVLGATDTVRRRR